MGCYDLTIKVKIGALLKVPAYLDRNIDKAFVFNELNIFRKEEYIFLFQKFLVLFVTNGVLQKYLRIVCITMIQNDLIMNSISVYWKKLKEMSYIIKSWTDSPYNNREFEVLFWDSKLSSWNYEQNVGQ